MEVCYRISMFQDQSKIELFVLVKKTYFFRIINDLFLVPKPNLRTIESARALFGQLLKRDHPKNSGF